MFIDGLFSQDVTSGRVEVGVADAEALAHAKIRPMTGGQVQLVDLVKRFTEVTAVDGINLEITGGEFFSLLGPSGCGKTTTLRLIAGFEQPTEGTILLDGRDVAHTPPHKRNVNTVFQSYALFPFLTVEENVSFGLRYKHVTKAEAKQKTAYEISLGLVGSEMCIRDRYRRR